MRLSKEEKEILYAWGSDDYGLTVSRLAHLAALTIDKTTKRIVCRLHDRLFTECTEGLYRELFRSTRKEFGAQTRRGLKIVHLREEKDE